LTTLDSLTEQFLIAMEDVPWRLYFSGLFGSAAVEFTSMIKSTLVIDGDCPPLYKKPFYILARAGFALFIAAPLPTLLGATSILTAIYIGASAPLIFDRLASGILPDVSK